MVKTPAEKRQHTTISLLPATIKKLAELKKWPPAPLPAPATGKPKKPRPPKRFNLSARVERLINDEHALLPKEVSM